MIHVIVILVIVGLLLWLFERYVPVAEPIRIIIRVVVILAIILWLLQVFGIADWPLPRVKG